MKKQMNYTKEFKVKACELVLKEEVKVKTVAEKNGHKSHNAVPMDR